MKLRVMLVDQTRERSAILQQALRDAGYEVVARVGSEENKYLLKLVSGFALEGRYAGSQLMVGAFNIPDEFISHLLRRQQVVHQTRFYCTLRHTGVFGSSGLLSHDHSQFTLYSSKAKGSVCSHS